MKLLAGDVGGTKTILALVENGVLVRRHTYPSKDFPGLAVMIEHFLADDRGSVGRACFGIAGPVANDSCVATNLPWFIDGRELERTLGITRVKLVNDFHALAIGITSLGSSEFAVLNDAPSDPAGPWVVIGAGTGLGQAVVVRGPGGYEVISSEGGHTDFAPRNELEIDLLRFMLKRHHRVSYERVVSGMGLVALYDFMKGRNDPPESPRIAEEMARSPEDIAAIVSGHALKGDDPLCERTLELFVSLYGAEAGNLALKVIARGGVYVAGGIAPKILPKMLDGTFRKAFVDKGRMSPILEATPVKVVLNPDVGLLGAAAIATTLAL